MSQPPMIHQWLFVLHDADYLLHEIKKGITASLDKNSVYDMGIVSRWTKSQGGANKSKVESKVEM
jgi:hypothetical protein